MKQMTPELYQRLKPLFEAALEMPPQERRQFVADISAEDSELGGELKSMLEASDQEKTADGSPFIKSGGFLRAMPGRFADGELVLDRFRIVRYLDGGGMGDVYEAMDTELGRVALKTIRADVIQSRDLLARFKREVQLARKVSGPHVCRIHELFVMPGDGNGPNGALLTMEFLEGVTLANKLRQSGPMPWRDARRVMLEICEGLQAIHQAGIIHRDLKCGNVMLASRKGGACAVVMDFGLAREVDASKLSAGAHLTQPNAIHGPGTPPYMAPEQFIPGEKLSTATDIYALGVVLYELVTGKLPFEASTPSAAAVSSGRKPPRTSSIRRGVPRRCDAIIAKCVEFEPKLRYQFAHELAEDIRGGLFSLARFRRRRRTILLRATGAIVLLSSLLLVPAIRERVQGILFSSSEKHIVVLPFDLAGSDPQDVALADGLMDSLAGKLSNLDAANHSLWVVPASEVRRHKVSDPASALREFGATIVIEGRFERQGGGAQLNLTLIDTKKMREIGFADVEDSNGDLAALQDNAVTRLGRLMNVSVEQDLVHEDQPPATRAAYEDYLAALGYIQRYDKPGNLDLAATSLESAVKTDPHFALGFARLAQVYVLKNRLDKNPKWLTQAENYCNQALQLDSRVPLAHVTLARIDTLTGHPDLAIEEFQRILDVDPRDADALTGLAHVYQDENRNSDAEAAFIKATALRPDDWNGYNNLARFYAANGRHQEAIVQYQRALQLTPDNFALYANLGAEYIDSGDPKLFAEAEQDLKKSIAINPSYQAYATLGNLYALQHRLADSIDATQKALQINSQNYDVWNNLAEDYELVGNHDKANAARQQAIQLLEQAVKQDPQDEQAQSSLAALLAKNGLKDQAMAKIQTSLALSPNSWYVLGEVADAYESLGDRQRAIKYLELALQNGFPPDQLNGDADLVGVLADPHFQPPHR